MSKSLWKRALTICLAGLMVAPLGITAGEFGQRIAPGYANLSRDPDLLAMRAIRDSMTQRVVDRSIDLDRLKAAYVRMDGNEILGLFQVSNQEAAELDARLRSHAESLLFKFPWLAKKAAIAGPCTTCNVERGFAALRQDVSNRTSRLSGEISAADAVALDEENEDGSEADCKWVEFTIAEVACAMTGPWIYWLCSYLVYCRYCTGPVVDAICK